MRPALALRMLHEAEQALRTTGKPVTILRAPYFIENWAQVLGAVTGQGVDSAGR
jgi:uncharacterized protein YbjT (DUF2867 family)